MSSRVFRIARWVSAVIIFSVFLYAAAKMIDPDLGWHLKVGEWVVSSGAVPRADLYSYTMPGFPWVDHEWLVDAFLWFLYTAGAWWFAVACFAVIASVPFFVWCKRARNWVDLWACILAGALMVGFVGVRPQIVSFLLFFLVFEILAHERPANTKARISRRRLLLPAIFLIWANLHAGFFSGVLLYGVWIAGEIMQAFLRDRRISVRRFIPDAAIFSASALATLVNPYGWRIYKELFDVAVSPYVFAYIAEWRPGYTAVSIALAVFIAAALFFTVRFLRQHRAPFVVSGAVFFGMFLRSLRMAPMFLVAGMPLVTRGAAHALAEIRAARARVPIGARGSAIWNAVIVFGTLCVLALLVYPLWGIRQFPLPERAVDFLNAEAARGTAIRIFNDYGWGGYLILHAPQIRVFVDGRMPHWEDASGNSAMKDYVAVAYASAPDAWREVFEKRGVNTVLTTNQKFDPSGTTSSWSRFLPGRVSRALRESFVGKFLARVFSNNNTAGTPSFRANLVAHGWEVAYEDDIAVVLWCRAKTCLE